MIKVRGVSKLYGAFKAVSGLDLDVERGDVFGFLGPNGAGKSTTIRMLLGLISYDEGTIEIFRQDLRHHRKSILARTGCIVEKPDFYKYLSAESNLKLLADISGINLKKNKIQELIELVGLKGREKDAVKNYSHGMKQRLGLAQALIHNPELIILDEPTTGLDPQGIIDIRNLIKHLANDQKKTIVLSSHILSETELIVNRLAILNKGRVVVQGGLRELLNDENAFVFFRLPEPQSAMNLLADTAWIHKVQELTTEGIRFQLHLPEISALNSYLAHNGIAVTGIETRRQLEDLFLRLTESAERMGVLN